MDGFELSFDDGEINARLIGLAQREAGVLGRVDLTAFYLGA
jgi:hypothetical protein